MSLFAGIFYWVFALCSALGQSHGRAPVFSGETIRYHHYVPRLFAPGMVVELYGSHLAGEAVCGEPNAPDLSLKCDVRVRVGGSLAELLYVSEKQINFKIPYDAPTDAFAPLQVCVGSECSASVPLRFSTKAVLSVKDPAFIRMPVWIRVDPPPPHVVAYPCFVHPFETPGYRFEVRKHGKLIEPVPLPPFLRSSAVRSSNDCLVSGLNLLPLHLTYRFTEPGKYEVRLIATKNNEVLYESNWTDLTIEPIAEDKRDTWLRRQETERVANGDAAGHLFIELLAWPDEKSLKIIVRLTPAESGPCRNTVCMMRMLGRVALAWFDDTLIERAIPAQQRLSLCPPAGHCN